MLLSSSATVGATESSFLFHFPVESLRHSILLPAEAAVGTWAANVLQDPDFTAGNPSLAWDPFVVCTVTMSRWSGATTSKAVTVATVTPAGSESYFAQTAGLPSSTAADEGRVSAQGKSRWAVQLADKGVAPTFSLRSGGSTLASVLIVYVTLYREYTLRACGVRSSVTAYHQMGVTGDSVYVNNAYLRYYTMPPVRFGAGNVADLGPDMLECTWEGTATVTGQGAAMQIRGTSSTSVMDKSQYYDVRRLTGASDTTLISEERVQLTVSAFRGAASGTAAMVLQFFATHDATSNPIDVDTTQCLTAGPCHRKLRLPPTTQRVKLTFRLRNSWVNAVAVTFRQVDPPTRTDTVSDAKTPTPTPTPTSLPSPTKSTAPTASPTATRSLTRSGSVQSTLSGTLAATATATSIWSLSATMPLTASGTVALSMTRLSPSSSATRTLTAASSASDTSQRTVTVTASPTESHPTTPTASVSISAVVSSTPTLTVSSNATASTSHVATPTGSGSWTVTRSSSASNSATNTMELPVKEPKRPQAIPAVARGTARTGAVVVGTVSAVVGGLGGGAFALQRVAALSSFCQPFDPDDAPSVFEHPLRFAAGSGSAPYAVGAVVGTAVLAVMSVVGVCIAAAVLRVHRGPDWRVADPRWPLPELEAAPAPPRPQRQTTEFTFAGCDLDVLADPLLPGVDPLALAPATESNAADGAASKTEPKGVEDEETAGRDELDDAFAGLGFAVRRMDRPQEVDDKAGDDGALDAPTLGFMVRVENTVTLAWHYLTAVRAVPLLTSGFVILGPMAVQPGVAAAAHGDSGEKAVGLVAVLVVAVVPLLAVLWAAPPARRDCALDTADSAIAAEEHPIRLSSGPLGVLKALWKRAWVPAGQWRERQPPAMGPGRVAAPPTLARQGALFTAYRGPWHWFLAAEAYSSLLVAGIGAASSADAPYACVAAEAAAVGAVALLLVGSLVLRPYLMPADAVMAIAGGVLEVVAATMRVAGLEDDVVAGVLLALAAVALLQMAFAVVRRVRRAVVRFMRLQRPAPPAKLLDDDDESMISFRVGEASESADSDVATHLPGSFDVLPLPLPEGGAPATTIDIDDPLAEFEVNPLDSPAGESDGGPLDFDGVLDGGHDASADAPPADGDGPKGNEYRAVRASNAEYTARLDELQAMLGKRDI